MLLKVVCVRHQMLASVPVFSLPISSCHNYDINIHGLDEVSPANVKPDNRADIHYEKVLLVCLFESVGLDFAVFVQLSTIVVYI